jgi:hypothetical protein
VDCGTFVVGGPTRQLCTLARATCITAYIVARDYASQSTSRDAIATMWTTVKLG